MRAGAELLRDTVGDGAQCVGGLLMELLAVCLAAFSEEREKETFVS